ncbi:agamous-like MADS-box protein AGL31 [Lycium ferocissimum]|uniref:agamous-like MADS-box protein AGL31 n=1 Tax=Lycium ferocissimum TaxID=112874 RepID=UPI002814FD51|nr:agamous-like MADS-box protein AGL31 [Lycium ferocissimum]
MGTGKKKIEIKQIIKEGSRMVTFSKRRKWLFKKASQLESMTNARVAINGLCDWLEKIDVEECGNLDELLLLKEQLEGTRDKLAEHSESFEALFV